MKKAIKTCVKWDVTSQVWQHFHEGNHRETEHFLVYILVRSIRESHVGGVYTQIRSLATQD